MTFVDQFFKKNLLLFPNTDEGLTNPQFQLCKHWTFKLLGKKRGAKLEITNVKPEYYSDIIDCFPYAIICEFPCKQKGKTAKIILSYCLAFMLYYKHCRKQCLCICNFWHSLTQAEACGFWLPVTVAAFSDVLLSSLPFCNKYHDIPTTLYTIKKQNKTVIEPSFSPNCKLDWLN